MAQLMAILFLKVSGATEVRFIIVLQRHKMPPASYNPKGIKESISGHLWVDNTTYQNTKLHDPSEIWEI